MENISWLGHSSFQFNDSNNIKVYFIDPFEIKNKTTEKADLIFITHAHPDHFSYNDMKHLAKSGTAVVAPNDILEKINDSLIKINVAPNNNYSFKNFKFYTIPAYNNNPQRLKYHPKSNNWVGYIFEINNQKIYHAGDTDFIEEMKNLEKLDLDIAMLPIGGTYTMNFQEAALAANAIKAKITIPIHYKNLLGENYKTAEEKFKILVTNSKVIILEEL